MKLLVLGASHSEYHLSKTLRELGHTVVHLAQGEAAFCDKEVNRISEDYSDIQKVKQNVETGGFGRVVPGANDFASRTASHINGTLGQTDDSIAQWEAIHLKDGLRTMQLKLNLPSLMSQKINLLGGSDGSLNFPVFIKATNLTGGKGVRRASSGQELESISTQLLARYPRSEFIIQESFSGPLYSVTGLVIEGVFVPVLWFQEFTTEGNYWIKNAVSVNPETDSLAPFFLDLESQLSSICAYLGLAGGIMHCQFTFHKGRSVIFDLARRIPGDMLVRSIELALGPVWFKILVSGVLFDRLELPSPPRHNGGILRHCLTGRVGRIAGGYPQPDYPGDLIEHFALISEGSAILDLAQKVAIDFVALDPMTAKQSQSVAELAQRLEY